MRMYKYRNEKKTLSVLEPVGNWKDCYIEIPFDETLNEDLNKFSDFISKTFEIYLSFKPIKGRNIFPQDSYDFDLFQFFSNKDDTMIEIGDKDISIWFEIIQRDTQNREKIDKCAKKLYNTILENKNKIIFEKETSRQEKFMTYYLLKKCCELAEYNFSDSKLSFSLVSCDIEKVKLKLTKFENDKTEVEK